MEKIATVRIPFKWTVVLTLCALSWGAIHPINKNLLNAGVDPYMISLLRFLITTLVLIPSYAVSRKRKPKPSIIEILRLSLAGVLGIALYALLFAFGLRLTNPSSSSIIINSQPIFMTIFGMTFLKEKHAPLHLPGLIIGSLGIFMVVSRGDFSALVGGESFLVGNLLCVGAAVLISIFYVELKGHVRKFGTTIPTFIATAAGSVALAVAALAAGSDFSILTRISGGNWLGIIHVSVIATALAATVYHKALHEIGVGRASGFKFLTPLFGVIMSIVFLDDHMNLWMFLGMAMVLIAITLIHSGGERPRIA